jgi:transposase-like protein
MAEHIDQQTRTAIIQDIFTANHDVVALAEAHGLTPDQLAQWIGDAANQQCLSGLCVLADLQTQLMLSRYRLVAVTKLIQQATQQEDVSAEQARKACADLLKLDLTRLGFDDVVDEASGDSTMQQLQKLLYGDEAEGNTTSDDDGSDESG